MKKYRKYLVLKVGLFLMMSIGYGQNFKPLQVGDTIPEAFYQEARSLGLAGELFSKTRDRLIILDFWSIYCGTCIEALPRMEAIQKEFNSEIQIFLVNAFEDSLQIANRMRIPSFQQFRVNLPSIANAKVFRQLFPHKVVPHHVWIDQNGVVRVIGSSLNTNRNKIVSFLNKEEITFLKGTNNSNTMNEQISLHEIKGKPINNNGKPSFLFSTHLNDYSPTSSISFEGYTDNAHQFVRDTYINYDVLELYKQAYDEIVFSGRNKVIYSGILSNTPDFWRDYFILDVQDTFKLTSVHIPFIERTDQQYTKSAFCYEQLTFSKEQDERKSYMLKNLNAFFEERLGIEVNIIDRMVACYILKSDYEDNIPDKKHGRTALSIALANPVYKLFSQDSLDNMKYMIDETGLEDITGLKIPDIDGDYQFKDIVIALNNFGIVVEEEIRTMKFISIKGLVK